MHLVFTADGVELEGEIVSVNIQTGEVTNLTDDEAQDVSVDWRPCATSRAPSGLREPIITPVGSQLNRSTNPPVAAICASRYRGSTFQSTRNEHHPLALRSLHAGT
jgi:hypothetical protein